MSEHKLIAYVYGLRLADHSPRWKIEHVEEIPSEIPANALLVVPFCDPQAEITAINPAQIFYNVPGEKVSISVLEDFWTQLIKRELFTLIDEKMGTEIELGAAMFAAALCQELGLDLAQTKSALKYSIDPSQNTNEVWQNDYSQDLLVGQTSKLAWQHQSSLETFTTKFKELSSHISFKRRTELRMAVEKCFLPVWRNKNAA